MPGNPSHYDARHALNFGNRQHMCLANIFYDKQQSLHWIGQTSYHPVAKRSNCGRIEGGAASTLEIVQKRLGLTASYMERITI